MHLNRSLMTTEIKKLYDVPRDSYIKIARTDDMNPNEKNNPVFDTVFHFHHVDGMYSLCKDKVGDILHISAFTDVIVVGKEEFENQ